MAQELHNIQITEHSKMITLDLKRLYVNLLTKNILRITEFWLNKNNHDPAIIEQVLYLLKIALKQKYFQHNNQFYQPNKGITIGSPVASTLAEIYLQYWKRYL